MTAGAKVVTELTEDKAMEKLMFDNKAGEGSFTCFLEQYKVVKRFTLRFENGEEVEEQDRNQ